MEQKNVDQGPGATGVTFGFPGCIPERFVGVGERARRTGMSQRGRSGQSTGLVVQDLEVVVQVHALAVEGDHPSMAGDLGAAVEDDDFRCAQGHPDGPADESCRNRVRRRPYPHQAGAYCAG